MEHGAENFVYHETDPAKWVLNTHTINYFVHKKVPICLESIKFKSTSRKIGKYSRYLPRQVFTRKLHNGERKSRDWVLYSCSENSLYCYYCLLFARNKTAFSHQGKEFINWKKRLDYVKNHEKKSNSY